MCCRPLGDDLPSLQQHPFHINTDHHPTQFDFAMVVAEDVEMKTSSSSDSPSELQALVLDDIKQNFSYLETAVANFDPRYTLKVLRGLPSLRKRIDTETLLTSIELVYSPSDVTRSVLTTFINGGVETSKSTLNKAVEASTTILPEIDIFVHLLVQAWLMNTHPSVFKAFSAYAIRKLQSYNRRSLDYLAAKVWFYYSRSVELDETDTDLDSITPQLLSALRTATLRNDFETQASLITLLLRHYLVNNNVNQAANLVAKASFPESASNSLAARFFYYLAWINAIQLDYSSAFERITAAIRKAPQTPLAIGFQQAAHKLSVIVELLMGDIPDRSIFKEPTLERVLAPYFEITKAVKQGNVALFSEVVQRHQKILKKDRIYALVLRLRQNVIKTGIRIMSLTYSNISLKDICVRLHLDSEESAEYMVAKAIRDGVIDAVINHEKGFMQSKEILDIYSTKDPQEAFHERIKFCISLHDDSVKSMRYDLNDHRSDLKTVEKALEREKELFSEMQDDSDDDDY